MTSAKKRMVRGDIQYNAISRFVREIPENLLDGNTWEPKPRDEFGSTDRARSAKQNPFMTMKPSATASIYEPRNKPKDFGTKIEKNTLSYGVGDRVRHIKFGEGTVTLINDGGRDFEVTVDFDRVGVKKMFASFAKLQKI